MGEMVSLGPPVGLPFLAHFVVEVITNNKKREKVNKFFTVKISFILSYKVTIYLGKLESNNLKVNGMGNCGD